MQQDPLIGTILGNYRILAPLGQGGMAHVYRARQENLDREVAVKVLPPWYAADRNFVERFILEARLVAKLSHPNIVTIHDFNKYQDHLYIVMELVDGGTLKHILDRLRNPGGSGSPGVMDPVEALNILKPLASALTYAHEKGIIHRDIKPVNVLMDRTGRPILSDFGIAKVLAGGGGLGLTRPGAGVGTPEYMSPEQCKGEDVDGRADIYALGVMVYEALTGRTPFIGENYPALAHSHIYEPPPDPRQFNPRLPVPICRVVLTALQKKPELRYQRADDMAIAFEQALRASTSNVGNTYGSQPTPHLIERYPTTPQSPNPPKVVERYPTTPLYLCPHCKQPNKGNTFYCTRCGSLLNQCPNCRHQNKARDRFCIKCGTRLTIF
ncbi:MAG TPA: serine/threonine-protein kinase [Ktedonobacteraceae bacterium]|jgi:serine/threonine-protein kinase|nr:serine/threonine-protein kinase [Ktedonobacteraceae bacterium]